MSSTTFTSNPPVGPDSAPVALSFPPNCDQRVAVIMLNAPEKLNALGWADYKTIKEKPKAQPKRALAVSKGKKCCFATTTFTRRIVSSPYSSPSTAFGTLPRANSALDLAITSTAAHLQHFAQLKAPATLQHRIDYSDSHSLSQRQQQWRATSLTMCSPTSQW